jgi:hypothetical protein
VRALCTKVFGLALSLCILAVATPAGAQTPPQDAASPGAASPAAAPAKHPGDMATARDLVKGCQARLTADPATGDPVLSGGRCKEYLISFFTQQKDNLTPRPEERFCTNGVVSFGKVARTVIDFAEGHADLMEGLPDPLIMAAMHTAYPCTKQDPQ